MNRDKLVSSVVFVCVALLGVVAYGADRSSDPVQVLPTVATVLPGPLPLDTSHAASLPVQTARETVITAQAPRKAPVAPAKVWTCGSPEGLENDAFQTVRRCEWR